MQNKVNLFCDNESNFLIGDRIELKEVGEWGLAGMYEYGKDPDFYKYMEGSCFKSEEDAEKYLARWRERIDLGEGYLWLIVLKKENKVIGSVSLFNIDINRMSVGYGYGLSLKYTGNRYIEEALKIIFDLLFVKHEFHRVHGLVSVDNIQSAFVAHKFRLKQEGVLRDYYRYSDNEWGDAISVSLLRNEYIKMNK